MAEKRNNQVGPQAISKNRMIFPYVCLVVIIAGFSIATQFFAYLVNYHDSLGTNLNGVYFPWDIVKWYLQFYSPRTANVFMKAGSVASVFVSVCLIALVIYKMVKANSVKTNAYLHGSARWAGKKDIKEAGLFSKTGVYVGAWEDPKSKRIQYLKHNGAEHVLTYAPTRSGKGVGLVIPTLLSWGQSAVITDLKGELWAITAGWRKEHAKNKVIKFEPAAASGAACWNPLDEIRIGTVDEVGDVQNLVLLLLDPEGKGLRSHWDKTSNTLLVGCIIHLLYKIKREGGIASLATLDAMMANPERPIEELWDEMRTYPHLENGDVHPTAAAAATDMVDRAEEEATSVLSTAKSVLELFRDPVVAYSTSKSDFKIDDIKNHDSPVSLYIVTKPNNKDRLKPLVRVLVNMIIRLLADEMNFKNGRAVKDYKHKVLLMFDEFPSLGKLEIMQNSLAFIAGYGLKAYLICQDINQLKSREEGYGPDEAITSNCHVQNAYPPNRIETAEHLSKLTGTTTVLKEQITTSGKRMAGMHTRVSKTIQETSRPLLTPDEAMRLPGPKKNNDQDIIEAGDMVVYVAGYPAIYGRQPLFFKDAVFQERASVEPPKSSDILVKLKQSIPTPEISITQEPGIDQEQGQQGEAQEPGIDNSKEEDLLSF